MKRTLVIAFIPNDIAELDGFPTLLGGIVGSIQDGRMGMQLRVGGAVEGGMPLGSRRQSRRSRTRRSTFSGTLGLPLGCFEDG